MEIDINLDNLKSADGAYSEKDVKALEKATGMEWKDIHTQAKEQQSNRRPVSDWSSKEKIAFVDEHGQEAYKKLVDAG